MFEGQQTDEKILYTITPHKFALYIAIVKIIFLSVFFYLVLLLIATVVPQAAMILQIGGFILSAAVLIGGLLWNKVSQERAKTYITDRRIIRFEQTTPFFLAKRALFWSEGLKAKGYSPNLIYKFLKLGSIIVEPQQATQEDVRVTDVYYYEDLANYIDKILYTVKNKPENLNAIQPFVPKPRGKRY